MLRTSLQEGLYEVDDSDTDTDEVGETENPKPDHFETHVEKPEA